LSTLSSSRKVFLKGRWSLQVALKFCAYSISLVVLTVSVSVLIYRLAVTLNRMRCVKMVQEAADDFTICRHDYPGSYDAENNQCVKLPLKVLPPTLSTLFIAL